MGLGLGKTSRTSLCAQVGTIASLRTAKYMDIVYYDLGTTISDPSKFNSIQVPLSGPVALSMEYQKKIRSEQKATSAGPSRTTSRAINVAGKSVTFFTKLVQSS